ncbi:MAG: LPS assembly protein LptD [Rickettsiales bacterium]|jgi:LPS-assembly protein|nr:LPS assembly protein LptD [Rickettsiales bacterium]
MRKLFGLFFITFTALPQWAFSDMSVNTDTSKTITADKIEYNTNTKAIKTTGDTKIQNQSGQSLNLRNAYVADKNIASGDDITLYLTPHTRITADSITKTDGNTSALDATYTNCAECDKTGEPWKISASRVYHDDTKKNISLYDSTLWFYDIPVFWSPWISYPDPRIKYKSGFLTPSINSTNNMGMQFNLPLYLNFSDYHDLTITTSYLTKENPLFLAEHNLNTKRANIKTTGSFTHTHENQNRWHLFNDDLIELGDNARMLVFFNRTSDKTYLQQYDFYNNQPYLDSGARLELFASRGYTTIDSHFFQELRVTNKNTKNPSGNILPNIHGVYQTAPLVGNTYFSFMGDVLGIQKSNSSNQRILGESRVVSPWFLPFGQKLTLSAAARYDLYNFIDTPIYGDLGGYSGTKGRFLPSGYVDWSMPFIRYGQQWTNIIEPRARATFQRRMASPNFINTDSAGSLLSDAMLFSDNRLSGYDLWGNSSYTDYGVNWTAFNNDGIQTQLFLGQSYDFFVADKLDKNSGFHDGASDYVGRADLYVDNFSIANRFRVSNTDLGLRHLESIARFGHKNYIDAGYIRAIQFTDTLSPYTIVSELVLGGDINITQRLSLRGRAIYNITNEHLQRLNAGLYYDHPCYTLSLDFSRDGTERLYVDGENYYGGTRLRFQFSLKLTDEN